MDFRTCAVWSLYCRMVFRPARTVLLASCRTHRVPFYYNRLMTDQLRDTHTFFGREGPIRASKWCCPLPAPFSSGVSPIRFSNGAKGPW
jgi:hypothetical protein